MSVPEVEPQTNLPEGVTETSTEMNEIPAAVEQGIRTTPTTPAPVQGDNNQTIAQPVPAPSGDTSSITIPAQSQAQLTQMAQGAADDSQTWFGVFWLFKLKRALRNGMQVLFGEKQ
jgi:hypothetical protein